MNSKNFFPNSIFQILLLLIISTLFTVPLVPLYFKDHDFLIKQSYPLIFGLLWITIFIGITFFVNKRRGLSIGFSFDPTNTNRSLGLMILIVILFQSGIAKPVNHLLLYFFDDKANLSAINYSFFAIVGPVLIGPILEELIFRGIILKGLLTRYSPQKSIIISAILFGLIHIRPLRIWGAIFIGIYLGWIYYKTQSVGVTIILHIAANAIVILQSFLIDKFLDNKSFAILSMIFIPFFTLVLFFTIKTLNGKIKNLGYLSEHEVI